MKKIFFLAIAACALTFASCGNGPKANVENADEVEAVEVDAAADGIAAALEAGDVSALQAAIDAAKEKAAELLSTNPELAQAYLEKVQNFLKENAEKVQAVVGDNEVVKTVVNSVVEAPVEQVVSGLSALVGNAEAAANQTVEDTKAAANQAVEDTKAAAEAKVNEEVQKAKDKTNEAIDKSVEDAKKKLGLK